MSWQYQVTSRGCVEFVGEFSHVTVPDECLQSFSANRVNRLVVEENLLWRYNLGGRRGFAATEWALLSVSLTLVLLGTIPYPTSCQDPPAQARSARRQLEEVLMYFKEPFETHFQGVRPSPSEQDLEVSKSREMKMEHIQVRLHNLGLYSLKAPPLLPPFL